MTQIEAVLKYIQDNGSITTYEAFAELGCTRLSAKIYDLKHMGYQFKTEPIVKKSRYGKVRFYKYSLI